MVLSESYFDTIAPLILENRFPEIDQLTNEQNDALFALPNREDVFAILPTGHGKSSFSSCSLTFAMTFLSEDRTILAMRSYW